MKRKQQFFWATLTTLSLTGFSFAAGFGLKGLYQNFTKTAARSNPLFASRTLFAPDADLKPSAVYNDVLQKLEMFYVEKLPSDTLIATGSIDNMLLALNDPQTRLISPAEFETLKAAEGGEFRGLGAILTIRRVTEGTGKNQTAQRLITVVSPIQGGPADKAGLLPGDRITYVDGRWIAPMHLSYRELAMITDEVGPGDGRPRRMDEEPEENKPDPERDKRRAEVDAERKKWATATDLPAAMKMLTSERGGEHEIVVERPGQKEPITLKVAFQESSVPTVEKRRLNPTTGYVRLAVISPGTVRELDSALTEFQKGGVKNLVLDLRRNPGGKLESAVQIASMLQPGAPVVTLKTRDAQRKMVSRVEKATAGAAKMKPSAISVLVDRGTAGSAEVLAAALRDNLGARLVGANTFGDGTQQDVVPLDNGAAISITRAKMLSPKGVDFDGKGLAVDNPSGPGDAGIEAALKALTMKKPATTAKAPAPKPAQR